jgi:hypothetical protein
MDWQTWHDEYDRPGSHLAARLRIVRDRVEVVTGDAASARSGPVAKDLQRVMTLR